MARDLDIARRHSGFVNAAWARDAVEEILDTDDLNYKSKLVLWIFEECRQALADTRLAD